MKKLFDIFDTRLMIWFHYVLLVGALFVGFYIGDRYFNLSNLGFIGMFIFWYIVVSLSDQLIHSKYILNVD